MADWVESLARAYLETPRSRRWEITGRIQRWADVADARHVDALFFLIQQQDVPIVNPCALRRLFEGDAANRAKFLDAKFRKKRLAYSGNKRSQMWYLSQDDWAKNCFGTTEQPSGNTLHTLHATPNPTTKKQKVCVPKVRVRDGDTGRCAISGEKLVVRWDDDLQDWTYVDAVRREDGTVIFDMCK